MSKDKVSEKMQRAVRKLQSRIGNPNQAQYHTLSSDDASSPRVLTVSSTDSRKQQFTSSRDTDDNDESITDDPPKDVPEGFLAVYVGHERRRFVISANHLKHQTFKALLAKSAEEYGFQHQGGLLIACDVTTFENLLWTIAKSGSQFQANYCWTCFSVYSS